MRQPGGVASRCARKLNLHWGKGELADLMTKGYYSLPNGEVGVLLREMAFDRIQNEPLYFTLGVNLGAINPKGAPHLGPLADAVTRPDTGP